MMFFSAMPPVESLEALVSHVMTERVDKRGRILVLAVFDLSRAHFYGVCERYVYVEPPAELHRPGLVAKLNKTMYGTQDASNAWQKLWGEHLRNNGFELGVVTAAAEDQIEVFGKMLQEKFDTRRIGMIGAARHLDKELEVLPRSVRVINDELMEIEADQKHVPRLLEDLGLIQGNIVKTPRVKLSATEADAIENSTIHEGEQATLFRSGTMRCAYLAQDRADISESIKCLARGMSKTKNRLHDAVETCGEVPERSAKEGTAVLRTGTEQSTFGSARGQ